MIKYNQLVQMVTDQNRRILELEEQIQAMMPSSGRKMLLDMPVVDGEYAGRMSDLCEHGMQSPFPSRQKQILMLRAQRCYWIDPSGLTGRSWKHIVTPANATDEQIADGSADLAVDGWVP